MHLAVTCRQLFSIQLQKACGVMLAADDGGGAEQGSAKEEE